MGGRRGGSLVTGYGAAVVGGIEDYGYGSRCGGCVVGLVNGDGRGERGRWGREGLIQYSP